MPLLVEDEPLRVMVCSVVVPLDGGVDRHADALGMACFNLLFKKIALQLRVASFGMFFRFIVNPAVMTAGEAGDRVDVSFGQRLGKLFGVEVDADVGNVLACVKVEVNLPESQLERVGFAL